MCKIIRRLWSSWSVPCHILLWLPPLSAMKKPRTFFLVYLIGCIMLLALNMRDPTSPSHNPPNPGSILFFCSINQPITWVEDSGKMNEWIEPYSRFPLVQMKDGSETRCDEKALSASSGNSLDQGPYPIHMQLYRLFHCR